MTKREIVARLSKELNLSQTTVKEAVQRTLDLITEGLVETGDVELRDFGVFQLRLQKARNARNPRTGDAVVVPERQVVRFKPGKEMAQRVSDALAWNTQSAAETPAPPVSVESNGVS